jgi:hypothetical protein
MFIIQFSTYAKSFDVFSISRVYAARKLAQRGLHWRVGATPDGEFAI